jgi:hypothetical protein
MTPQHSNDLKHLAEQASTEMDHDKLMELVTEINRVLGEREEASRQNFARVRMHLRSRLGITIGLATKKKAKQKAH